MTGIQSVVEPTGNEEDSDLEMLLQVLQDLVALTLASIGIGAGVMTALGDIRVFQKFTLRILASVLFLGVGLWIFYTGIRHLVSG